MKTVTFSSLVATTEFSKFVDILSATASSFRIVNSSTGTPSPPLALLVVMFPKAPLTSHSRVSGSVSDHSDWCTVLCVFVPPLLSIFFY